MLKVIELFAGIGACSSALNRLNLEHEILDAVEIDKYAIKSFNALHGTNFNVQDITEWDKDFKDVDLIMHGSPCQDFSIAGKQAGGDFGSGTRSSLLYETVRIVGKIRPKYVVWENVKNVLSKKHKHNFDNYIETLNILGYNSYYEVLNAKDYGIPQNRERVFTVSIRKDIDKGDFVFPDKEELTLKLKDILENKVDDKYYLSEKMQKYVIDFNNTQEGTKWQGRVDNEILNSNIAHALGVRSAGGNQRAGVSNFVLNGYDEEIKVKDLKEKMINAQPLIVASRGRYVDNNKTEQHLEPNKEGTTNTITTVQKDNYVIDKNIKIRKLTPKECWRLMGFNDNEFKKAASVPTSDSQLYKQAGNSIVVNVLEKIFENLFEEKIK